MKTYHKRPVQFEKQEARKMFYKLFQMELNLTKDEDAQPAMK